MEVLILAKFIVTLKKGVDAQELGQRLALTNTEIISKRVLIVESENQLADVLKML